MKQAVDTPSQARSGSAAEASARRRMLRLVAGGVPLMAGPPAMASAVAASSAFRAARRDGTGALPALVSMSGDTWIRQPVQIVKLGPDGETSGRGHDVRTAYKVAIPGQTTRYYSVNAPYRSIELTGSPPLRESRTEAPTPVMMLALFDKRSFSMIPQVVDPTLYGRSSLQGLHCSSWSSIYPNGGRPLSCSGV